MRKFSALSFAAMLFGLATITWADPPAGRGLGVGSTVQRAVDSRAGLQQRANARAQGSANTATGIGIGQNSANANGGIGVSADIQAEVNGSANAQSGTGRLPREVVVRRLQLLRSQQSAAVRTATRSELGIGIGDDAPSDTPRPSGKKAPSNNKPSRDKSGQASNPNEAPESSDRSGLLSLNGSARSEIVAHGQNRLALTNADKIFAQRLARIDQMRDQGLETGNDQLLDQADRLELEARTKYAERLAASTDGPSSETGANAQGQATGAVRGRINRTTPPNSNPGTPADDGPNSDANTDSNLFSSDAAAATRNDTTASLRNKARQSNERTRGAGNSAGKTSNASLSGQANSSTAADAAARNNSLNATGTSATNAAANAQSK